MPRHLPPALLFSAALAVWWGCPAGAQTAPDLRGAVEDASLPPPGIDGAPPLEEPAPPRRRAEANPYAPTGIALGGLRLYPTLGVGGSWSSNIDQGPSEPESGLGLRLRPGLAVESEWVRHSFSASLAGDFTKYPEAETPRDQSLDAEARLQFDVRRGTAADLGISYAIDMPPDSSAQERTLAGVAGVSHEMGRIGLRLEGGLLRQGYAEEEPAEPGQDTSDRDYLEPSVTLRTSYGLSDLLRPYIEASVAPRRHDQSPDAEGYRRDSKGYAATAGVQVAAGPIWTGEMGLTYLRRSYDDSRLGSPSAFGLTGAITWSPTELLRIVMSADTAIDEATSGTEGGDPTWNFAIDASYDMRENVTLDAGLSLEVQDFGSSDDLTYEGGAELTWKLSPAISWTAGYDFTWLDAQDSASSYVEHRLSTGVILSR